MTWLGERREDAAAIAAKMRPEELLAVHNAQRLGNPHQTVEKLVELLYVVETRGDLLAAAGSIDRGAARLAFGRQRIGAFHRTVTA